MNSNNKNMKKQRNAIALFETDLTKIASFGISVITKSSWTHAAIRVNGKWYDASETRGYFSELNPKDYDHRWCIMSEFDGDLTNWIKGMLNKKYNWRGIFQFPFYFLNNRCDDHFYCFQAAWDAVWYSIYNEHFTPPKVSAESVKYLILELNDSSFEYRKGIQD